MYIVFNTIKVYKLGSFLNYTRLCLPKRFPISRKIISFYRTYEIQKSFHVHFPKNNG